MLGTVLWSLGGLIALTLLAAWWLGRRLPEQHTATVTLRVDHPAPVVFALISDPERLPAWRPDIKRLEVLEPNRRYREHGRFGPVVFAVETCTPPGDAPGHFTTRIVGERLKFGGCWRWTIEPTAGGAHITVTEEGFIRPPVFRALARYVLGHTATLTAVLEALEAHLATPPPPPG